MTTKLEKGRRTALPVRATVFAGGKSTEGSFSGRATRLLIPFLIFLSAFLLFQVQLIIGKYLLPWFGGAASVWTTCLLAFQLLLLAGYGYAHLSEKAGPMQARIHAGLLLTSIAVLALLALWWETPITPGASFRPEAADNPIGRILLVLAATVALPFFLLSTTTPLLQSWYRAFNPDGKVYRLYALSNLGSLTGLLSYPFVVEPNIRLSTQAWLWSGGYAVFAVATAWSAFLVQQPHTTATTVSPAKDGARPNLVQRGMWVALAACGTALLLAVTNFISQDLAVVPLIWVLPLALYLLSFVITFESSKFYRRALAYPALALAMAATVHVLFRGGFFPVLAAIWILCAVLFVACFFCHGELARLKPEPRYLTWFYLSVAAGGALGTAVVGLLAPNFFRDLWELPIALGFCALLAVVSPLADMASWIRRSGAWKIGAATLAIGILPPLIALYITIDMSRAWLRNCVILIAAYAVATGVLWLGRKKWEQALWPRLLMAGVPIMVTVLFLMGMKANLGHLLLRERNFYGVLSVWERYQDDPIQHSYELYHGRVLHGLQLRNLEYRRRATTYYGNQTGVGLALRFHARRWNTTPEQATLRVGAVGLGTGTIALYAMNGDYFRFYELNPAIAQLTKGSDPYFSYLRDCRGRAEIVLGDARLSLELEAEGGESQQFDVLVLDAFSGDAIPVHLLTREAFEIYFKHLRDQDSVIAVHITNRVIDLAPVVGRLADELGLNGVRVHTAKQGDFVQETDWILLSRTSPVLKVPQVSAEVQPLEATTRGEIWTDDYSNVFSLLK